jgi:hypothetical protein
LRRFSRSLLLAGLALAGCRIEQTPQRYIDHQETPAEEIRASVHELRQRLLSVSAALQRGDPAEVGAALRPHEEAYVFGPAGQELRSARDIAQALQAVHAEGGLRVDEVAVDVGPRNNVAWFRAKYVAPAEPGAEAVRFSGVFVRQGGEWRLIQGHLSGGISQPPPPPPPEATVDTAAGVG